MVRVLKFSQFMELYRERMVHLWTFFDISSSQIKLKK